MKTVYSIATARTIKYLTGARAGKVSYTTEIKKVWDEDKKSFVVGFDTQRDAIKYIIHKYESYVSSDDKWKVCVQNLMLGHFVVRNEWGKKSKGETIDSWNVVPLVIE